MALHPRLKKIRNSTDLSLRPTKHLKTTFTGFDGQEHELRVRYYQVQGILHLVVMRRFVLGDDTGLGKTLQAIAALCYVWEAEPDAKAMVFTTKSATKQWAKEFAKFTTGVRVIICAGTPKKRQKARDAFLASTGPTVMITGYGSGVKDYTHMQNWEGFIFIADEATAFKNPKTQRHQVCKHLSLKADRTWALTATLIKNNLIEGYGIYKVVVPDLFKMSANAFMLYYCITRMQRIPKSNRMIPVIIGYDPKKIAEFKEVIEPFFLGRPKFEVASDLPALVSRIIEVKLSAAQQAKYDEAMEGLDSVGISALTIGEARKEGEAEVKEVTKLTAITYCQEIVNHLGLIDCEGPSGKTDALLDLLSEGDLADEKVIVFTRFRTMVDILMPLFKKNRIKAVRITGTEDEDEREEAKAAFLDPNSDVKVVCITMAGSDAINLQSAKAIVFFDTPWSAGDFIQIVGRMIRIGSLSDRCYAIHLIARGVKNTVDHRVMEVMNKKLKLIEAVIGRRIKGEQDMGAIIPVQNDISDLFDMLRADARTAA